MSVDTENRVETEASAAGSIEEGSTERDRVRSTVSPVENG
jgi:hypothetical protein